MTCTMTLRRLRWLATLYRFGSDSETSPLAAWRRGRRLLAASACIACLGAGLGAGKAATLRDEGSLGSAHVHLSDLFDQLGTTRDKVLGASPAPGQKITVEAPQLAAIARDYGVDWRPETGAERITLERDSVRLSSDAVLHQLHDALVAMGAPADGDFSMPGYDAPLVPVGAEPHVSISEANFDPANGRFTALLTVAAAGMESVSNRVSGQVAATQEAAVLTHYLHPGTVLAAGDVRAARVRMNLLHGNVAISVAAALGQSLRHDLPPGQPLTLGDVARPVLVARNSAVSMRLDAGEISLSAQGVALEDGGMGETVRVQNPSSKAVVMAMVTGGGEVRVLALRAPLQVAAQ
jgi:flagella basal body P-ring formation protein FlgA